MAFALGIPAIIFGWGFLKPFLELPGSFTHDGFILALNALPIVAAVAWLGLLVGRHVRLGLLPPVRVEIYVKLIDKETPRSRLTQALALGNDLFELPPPEGYDARGESWEFPPGSIVRGSRTNKGGASYLLAVPFESS